MRPIGRGIRRALVVVGCSRERERKRGRKGGLWRDRERGRNGGGGGGGGGKRERVDESRLGGGDDRLVDRFDRDNGPGSLEWILETILSVQS